MFHRIVVPLDHSEFAEQALGQAAALVRASNGELDLILVHEPLPMGGFGDAPWRAEQWEDEERYLQSTAEELSAGTGVPVTCALLRGSRVETICKRAWESGAKLIVMTSHGRTGLSRFWLGSVADGVMRHSMTPVLMLRPSETKAARFAARQLFKHVLVPLDGSPLGDDALLSATPLAEASDARITLLRIVVPVPMVPTDPGLPLMYPYPIAAPDADATSTIAEEAKQLLAETARRLSEQSRVSVSTAVFVAESPARGIINFAQAHGVDVIAMSTHGRGASRLFLGSVADKVIRGSEVATLVHRPLGAREKASIVDALAPAMRGQGTGVS
jgi:nucleotide-binding universal stress UspA family protein